MVVPGGMRYFFGTFLSSVKYQFPTTALVLVGLNNSTASSWGGAVWVSTSLTSTGAVFEGASSTPGDPPIAELARQFDGLPGSKPELGLTGTSENPAPSAASGHGGRVP